MTADTSAPTRWLSAAGIDVVLVLVFAAIGRASHERGLTPLGVVETAWPFLVGLALGWLVLVAWRAPRAVLRTGLPLAVIAVAGGMLLRLATGAGTALPFVVVATATLLLFLVGWRLVAALIARRARRDV
ncbi:DUF3054 domain-containing protein [Microbacterium resistens]|uniref:DUF3054 domain-containing protein n=1 Tax=Microbacterium resistens TaxID=156977 RepID=A0ABY3RSN6_9MICO|nr:DUF3054 domain-containing protein [Microbacterium resistens]UGS26916.1 DUF3054 domain-containing protein [Microbacterium resistens]